MAKEAMRALKQVESPDTMPALTRLLSQSALYRAALGACGFPVVILDAADPARPAIYVNSAFEEFFGRSPEESLGCPLAQLVLRGDEPLAHRLLAGSRSHWQINVWTKDGAPRRVETTIGAVRGPDGRVSHWVAAFAAVP